MEDVIIEILICIPVKSLIRFKCVSKYWYALIKSETFVSRHHLSRDGKKEILLLKRTLPDNEILQDRKTLLSFHDPDSPDSLVLPNFYVPFLENGISHNCLELYGPCNGLICLVYQDVIILCNPALREFELLAPTPFSSPDGYHVFLEGCGFCFDVKSNSYKLVQIWELDEEDCDYAAYAADGHSRVDLYNSNTNSWRQIDVMVPHVIHSIGFHLFSNGALHWWTREYCINGPLPMSFILSFHSTTEVFKQFELPECDEIKAPSLMVLNQCLAMVQYGGWDSVEPELVDIWVMKKYGVKESWTKELVDIGPYIIRYPPLVSWKNEWIVVETSSQLSFCALHTHECRKYDQFNGYEGSLDALIFTESLISLKVAFCCKRD